MSYMRKAKRTITQENGRKVEVSEARTGIITVRVNDHYVGSFTPPSGSVWIAHRDLYDAVEFKGANRDLFLKVVRLIHVYP